MKDFTITHIGNTALSLPMPFKFIKAKGEVFYFQMNDGTEYGSKKEGTPITFENDLWLCAYPTTQEFWEAVVKEAEIGELKELPSYFLGKHRPLENASWDEVQLFCNALNELKQSDNLKFRANKKIKGRFGLPSEVQWEYAAKANQSFIFSGSQNLNDVAWYDENSSKRTMPVGLKNPNAFGLFDMSGNVWEWCEEENITNLNDMPKGGSFLQKNDVKKVLRGGSFFKNALNCFLLSRFSLSSNSRMNNGGFRMSFNNSFFR
ncbi:formylglycine-generating enzyme family protein [uncultured Arcticibacterium sp.]|uniref:formylglycine-generating enzyme family protein n=1 Tax=uncultured Arcticibacterium sp. TaxID=2173042 RepID=UPI0030F88FB1